MIIRYILITLLLLITLNTKAFEPRSDIKHPNLALKTNLLYTATTLTPNLSAEYRINSNFSIQASGSYNPWNLYGTIESNKKLVHWIASIESRYYFSTVFTSHYVGIEPLGGMYNVSEQNLPFFFGSDSNQFRFEGYTIGIGANYGYIWSLTPLIAIEATVGIGYAYLNYDKFECTTCGNETESNIKKNFFGPTKLGMSLVFTF